MNFRNLNKRQPANIPCLTFTNKAAQEMKIRCWREHGISRAENTVKSLLNVFNQLKIKPSYITDYLLPDSPDPEQKDDEARFAVEMLMMEEKTLSLDFTDLVKFTLYILGNFPEVKAKWQERMNYVMVDEAQDCNAEDWEIVNRWSILISGKERCYRNPMAEGS